MNQFHGRLRLARQTNDDRLILDTNNEDIVEIFPVSVTQVVCLSYNMDTC